MPNLVDLWLPILVAAVFVFVVSSVVHMCLPIHRSDVKKLTNEADILAAIRKAGATPGDYMFPCPASMKDMASPEMLERYKQGPIGFVTLCPPGPPTMGKALGQWFVWCIVVGVFVAYIAGLALPRGAEFGTVFRVTGAIGVLGYAFSHVTNSIWKGASWVTTAKFVFDGVLYALTTAATFAWLWPAAA